jgi:hypothetical protein
MQKNIQLGETTIQLSEQYNAPKSDVLFLNVHEDEQTSIVAIESFTNVIPLNFVYIKHLLTRRVSFDIKNKSYSVDPNRIYTAKGRKATLEPSKGLNFKAKYTAKTLAQEILEIVNRFKTIVTLHNNTDVNYTIKSYLPGGDESQNTADIYVSDKWDADDFIYTTDKKFFNFFKKEDCNVILQDNSKYVNDGSLSVYCGKNNLPYINIEAQKGHLEQQKELIIIVFKLLNINYKA